MCGSHQRFFAGIEPDEDRDGEKGQSDPLSQKPSRPMGQIFQDLIEENIVLTCYRLARYWRQHPDSFLSLPVSMIRRHALETSNIMHEEQKARN